MGVNDTPETLLLEQPVLVANDALDSLIVDGGGGAANDNDNNNNNSGVVSEALRTTLNDDQQRQSLLEFLMGSERNVKPLLFWLDCNVFSEIDEDEESDNNTVKAFVSKMYEKFLQEDAPANVRMVLHGDTLRTLENAILQDDISSHMFDEAKKEAMWFSCKDPFDDIEKLATFRSPAQQENGFCFQRAPHVDAT